MIKTGQRILIACDCAKSLIDFRGNLIKELVKNNEVYVFTPSVPEHLHAALASLNVTVFENGLNGGNVSAFSDVRYLFHLHKIIRSLRPDVFFPYTLKPVVYGSLAARFNKVKKIIPLLSGLGNSFNPGMKKSVLNGVARSLLRLSLKNTSGLSVILQNKDDYQTLLDHKILSRSHIVHIVNGSGVDLDHYSYSAPNTNAFNVIMVSRLINAKGIAEYYEAAKILKSRYDDIEFRLIGAFGNNVDSIHPDLYRKITAGDVLNYLGEVDDVRPYISNSSIVVLPSYYGEGIPRCLLEAMATGRPVITCDSVGCRETVDRSDAANGFLIPVKNVPALVSKLEFYINNPLQAGIHGLNGLNLAKQKFDVNIVNRQMMLAMDLV